MTKFKKILKDYASVWVMLLCAAVVGTLLLTGRLSVGMVLGFANENKLLIAVIILALFTVKGVSAALMYNAIVMASGLAFSFPVALLLNSIGTVLCLSISYWIGRNTRIETLETLLDKHPKVKKYFVDCRDFDFLFSFLLHAIGLSMEVLGVLFGIMRIDYWKYVLSAYLAIIPGMVCFTYAGNSRGFSSIGFWILLGIYLAIIVVSFFYTKRKFYKKKEK